MSAERKTSRAPAALPRRPPLSATPGSRNRGFESSDPERQREAAAEPQQGAPAGARPQEPAPQALPETPDARPRRAKRDRG